MPTFTTSNNTTKAALFINAVQLIITQDHTDF